MTKRFLQKTDSSTGVIVEEQHLLRNRLHRDPTEGPALIRRDGKSGSVVLEWYATNDQQHRMDGPAIVRRHPGTGIVCDEVYYQFGRLHRIDGPADIRRDGVTGAVMSLGYYLKGILHRDPAEGPAEARYYPGSEFPTEEKYVVQGRMHRAKGPAYIERDPVTGNIVAEDFYDHGHLHRTNGEPARIRRNAKTGVVELEVCFRDGVCGHSPSQDFRPALIQRDGASGGRIKEEHWRNGRIIQEMHFRDGVMHRPSSGGPAYIFRSPITGEVTGEQYWEYGVEVKPPSKPHFVRPKRPNEPSPL